MDYMDRFETELGCTIIAVPAEGLVHGPADPLGRGILLALRMEQPGDGREIHVYLSPQDVDSLIELLENTPQRREEAGS